MTSFFFLRRVVLSTKPKLFVQNKAASKIFIYCFRLLLFEYNYVFCSFVFLNTNEQIDSSIQFQLDLNSCLAFRRIKVQLLKIRKRLQTSYKFKSILSCSIRPRSEKKENFFFWSMCSSITRTRLFSFLEFLFV